MTEIDRMNDLYDDGRHYDLLMLGTNDLPFYKRQAKDCRGAVLELACGTGRLTIPLALDGADITGLDQAPKMLDAARAKAVRTGVAVNFVQADARNHSLDRR